MKYRKTALVEREGPWHIDTPLASGERYKTDHETAHCSFCSRSLYVHGWIETLEGGHIVCPGDYILIGSRRERWPIKPDIFAETYEPAGDESQTVLYRFVAEMARELKANEDKGGWDACDPGFLMSELHNKKQALERAVDDDDTKAIRDNAADVANFAMMIADIMGALE